jgi:hypothetical protein
VVGELGVLQEAFVLGGVRVKKSWSEFEMCLFPRRTSSTKHHDPRHNIQDISKHTQISGVRIAMITMAYPSRWLQSRLTGHRLAQPIDHGAEMQRQTQRQRNDDANDSHTLIADE